MRPISGGSDPYGQYSYPSPRHLAVTAPSARLDARAVGDASPAADVELSIRLFADGGSISVRRHTVPEADGSRRTVGIDAVIR